ncbi:MAG TPA: DUF1559 domain-containing protein, partial [Lacipirellulaceae bacterium]|nr:DUF1559 domain-containing protein [Lacipirellulaceae bacterium]
HAFGDHKDHWYLGSDDIDVDKDLSECLGSTGVPINLRRGGVDPCAGNPANPDCQALQLSFSSAHPGTVNVVLCDGSVQTIHEGIDAQVWSDYGT